MLFLQLYTVYLSHITVHHFTSSSSPRMSSYACKNNVINWRLTRLINLCCSVSILIAGGGILLVLGLYAVVGIWVSIGEGNEFAVGENDFEKFKPSRKGEKPSFKGSSFRLLPWNEGIGGVSSLKSSSGIGWEGLLYCCWNLGWFVFVALGIGRGTLLGPVGDAPPISPDRLIGTLW